jgi:hypothetical protein
VLRGSENWTIKARDARRITAAEIKRMRKRTKYNLGFEQNSGIKKKLVATYKQNAP